MSPPGLATGVSFFFVAFGADLGLDGREASSAARRASFSAFFFAVVVSYAFGSSSGQRGDWWGRSEEGAVGSYDD